MMIVYTKQGCPWCNELRSFLEDKEVEFEEREVRNNPEYYKELKEKTGQDNTPTVELEEGEFLKDTDKEEVEMYLLSHGLIE